jgi:hypothetical protein
MTRMQKTDTTVGISAVAGYSDDTDCAASQGQPTIASSAESRDRRGGPQTSVGEKMGRLAKGRAGNETGISR